MTSGPKPIPVVCFEAFVATRLRQREKERVSGGGDPTAAALNWFPHADVTRGCGEVLHDDGHTHPH